MQGAKGRYCPACSVGITSSKQESLQGSFQSLWHLPCCFFHISAESHLLRVRFHKTAEPIWRLALEKSGFIPKPFTGIEVFLQSIVKIFYTGRKQCRFYLFGLSIIIFAHQINLLRCQMVKDRFQGSTESTIGNEMVWWQEKRVCIF